MSPTDPVSSPRSTEGVTDCLRRWGRNDAGLEELASLVYEDLRRLAVSIFAGESRSHTLQATALLHEVYLELSEEGARRFAHRGEFFAFAATLMRRALVDHARAKLTAKRGGGQRHRQIEEALDLARPRPEAFVALDEALQTLERIDSRSARIVELRFFAGLTTDELASHFQASSRTIARELRVAKAMLRRLLELDEAQHAA